MSVKAAISKFLSGNESAPTLVMAGAIGGVLAGISLGAAVSPVVGIIGMWVGAGVGTFAGVIMDREDCRTSHRTRELDDIIGVTSGSLGAPPSIPPRDPEVSTEAELRSWVTEWMTPQPPAVA